mmetsp:Transcript_22602/g.35741  ORF Transcript_22602/g.35741 Transcript_22602/m.35741 type:complete len:280 (-) Transcript_22602:381-1220(-)
MRESCSARSISSSMYSLAPRSTTVQAARAAVPLTYSSSPSPTRSSATSAAAPSHAGSKFSSPSMSAIVTTRVAPVALARRRASSFFTRRTAMHPASTKYFMHWSSMALVVRMTLAPASRIFWIFSLVMSSSRCRMSSTSFMSSTTTWMPICILCFCRLKSTMAIFAFSTRRGIAWEARTALSANPSTRCDSRELCPWHLSTWIAPTGYRATWRPFSVLSTRTEVTARTAMSAKKAESDPMILEDMEVLAAFIKISCPSWSTERTRFSLIYFIAALRAIR